MSNKLTVVKSNRIVEASYELTLNEQRLILACIAKIKRGESIDIHSEFDISAQEFSEMFGLTIRRAYDDLREASNRLYERSVFIKDPANNPNVEAIKTRWISSIYYLKWQGGVKLNFSPVMIPYISLLQSEFTIYNLEFISKMSSTYSIRIYELLAQWSGVGNRKIDLDELKEILCLSNKYSALKDFKNRVLHPALEEINKNSDLEVTYKQYKDGRRIKGFEFSFKQKEQFKPIKITREYIEKYARAGESYQQAEQRLRTALEKK